jgi:DNA replication protein DnaC
LSEMRAQADRIGDLEQAIAQCPECRGLGWVRPDVADPNDRRFGRLIPCLGCGDAVRELRELRVIELLEEHIARYTAFRGALRHCTFENFDTTSDQRVVTAYNAVIRFVRGEVSWAYLYGPSGNGKTHLAAAAVNRLIAEGRAVLFTTAPELLAMIREGFDAGQAENLIGLCQRVPWLVVDDLGAERLTDWAAEVLFRVFNARYTARAHTLVVSNVRPEEVPEARLRSRFLDVAVCQVVPNGGEDYRRCEDRAER